MNSLNGKVIIITGSSDGVGRAIALYFMQRQAHVVFHGRSVDKLKNLADSFDGLNNWLTIVGDISRESDCKRLVEQTLQKFGRLDILINNSVIVMKDSMSQYSLPEFDQLLAMNLHAIGCLSELCAPHLVKTQGKILNVNTFAAFFQFLQHPFAEIIKLAYEQFNRHFLTVCPDVDIKLFDPCSYFADVLYLADFCFTYKQQLHQWCKANEQLEESGQMNRLAMYAAFLVLS